MHDFLGRRRMHACLKLFDIALVTSMHCVPYMFLSPCVLYSTLGNGTIEILYPGIRMRYTGIRITAQDQ
jgi:hypothetical protein